VNSIHSNLGNLGIRREENGEGISLGPIQIGVGMLKTAVFADVFYGRPLK